MTAILPNEELLYSFLEYLDEIQLAQSEGNRSRKKVHQETAPVALEIYQRFYPGKKVEHASLGKNCHPNEVKFWADPVAIWILFEMLIEDGIYYNRNTSFRDRFGINLN
jgi:hypothetical protein